MTTSPTPRPPPPHGPPTPSSVRVADPATGARFYFDYLEPRPEDFNLGVLAHGQRSIVRFRGYTTRPITVDEHALRVGYFTSALAHRLGWPEHKSTVAWLWALLHDAHEALTPWGDCLGPGKTDEMRAVEALIDRAIWSNVHARVMHGAEIPQPDLAVCRLVEFADSAALYYEAMLWQPGAEDWAPDFYRARAVDAWPPGIADLHDLLVPLVYPVPNDCWHRSVIDAGAMARRTMGAS